MTQVESGYIVFETLRNLGEVSSAGQGWFLSQSLPVQILTGAAALAVLWVLWILLRVILVALRATFRGL